MTFKDYIPTKFHNFIGQMYNKFLYDFFPYAFMLLSSTAVGFSVSYQAIRATQKFLTLQSPYQLFFRTFITVGIGITGFLNTYLYFDINTLNGLLDDANIIKNQDWTTLMIAAMSGAFEAFTSFNCYPLFLSFHIRVALSLLYFFSATVLYLPKKGSILPKSFADLFSSPNNTASRTSNLFSLSNFLRSTLILINTYSTYLIGKAFSGDLINICSKLNPTRLSTHIIYYSLQTARWLYTFANLQFYLSKAHDMVDHFETIKSKSMTLNGILLLGLSAMNGLINGFIQTLNTAISPKIAFNIACGFITSNTTMISTFFKGHSFKGHSQNISALIPKDSYQISGLCAVVFFWLRALSQSSGLYQSITVVGAVAPHIIPGSSSFVDKGVKTMKEFFSSWCQNSFPEPRKP